MPMKIESSHADDAFVRFGISKNSDSNGDLYIGVKVPGTKFVYTAVDPNCIPQLVAELMTYYVYYSDMLINFPDISGHLNPRAIVKSVLVEDETDGFE